MSELTAKMMKTPDLNQERLDTLKKLYPDLFTIEGKLNPDELKKIIDPSLAKETERFELKWFGKSESKRIAFTPSQATLVYDESRSVNPEYADGNMIIEGENLEVLKVLLSGYRGKIKCIYIDPPYNTGKDFIYSDNFDESKEDYWSHVGATIDGIKVTTNNESDGRYHSNWLNLMYPRLLLCRQLLAENGVVFISIDDHELFNLQKICNEVFGEEGYCGCISVVNNLKGRNDRKYLATANEFLLMYSNMDFSTLGLPLTEEKRKEYKENDDSGQSFQWRDLRKRGGADTRVVRPNLFYPIYIDTNTKTCSLVKDENHSTEVYPMKSDGSEGCWRWGKSKVEINLNILQASKVEARDKWNISYRVYLEDNGEERVSKPKTVWMGPKFSTDSATKELRALISESIEITPKPVEFLKEIFIQSVDEDEYVLDFFSGSGTTAQAIIEMNFDDSIRRKFIMVQIPEKIEMKANTIKHEFNSISDITIERTKRVINRIENNIRENPSLFTDYQLQENKFGFKVYKIAKSHFPRVEFAPVPAKSDEENLALLNQYIKEKEASFNTLFESNTVFDEVLLKNGFMLNYSLEPVASIKKNKVYLAKDEFKETLVCLDASINKETLSALEPLKEKTFICLERALDTTMKWNLKHELGDKLIAL